MLVLFGMQKHRFLVRATPISWCECRIQKRLRTSIRRFCNVEMFQVFQFRHRVQTDVGMQVQNFSIDVVVTFLPSFLPSFLAAIHTAKIMSGVQVSFLF